MNCKTGAFAPCFFIENLYFLFYNYTERSEVQQAK